MFTTDLPFEEDYVYPSKVDYSALAESIVSGRTNAHDKVRAIYAWLCKNIAYDTTYTIYHADECYAARRGVCLAYSELFYHLAKCVGIKSRVIVGPSKDHKGVIDPRGHAWVYVYIDGKGMLLDPTWGAGSIVNGEFRHNKYIWSWYDVDPQLMIMTHFPEDSRFQFLDSPITYEEFKMMIPASAEWAIHKFDINRLFHLARRGRLELPQVHGGTEGPIVELMEFPLHRNLKVGRSYTFRIKIVDRRYNIYLKNFRKIVELNEWQDEGDGVYYLRYTVKDRASVEIVCRNINSNELHYILLYADPDSLKEQLENDKDNPLRRSEFKHVGNLMYWEWSAAGISPESLAQIIREQRIEALPLFCTDTGETLRIVDVPMHHKLKAGQSYTFRFYPTGDNNWALIEHGNGGDTSKIWHHVTERSSDGMLSITITPKKIGAMYLSFCEENRAYYASLVYDIVP